MANALKCNKCGICYYAESRKQHGDMCEDIKFDKPNNDKCDGVVISENSKIFKDFNPKIHVLKSGDYKDIAMKIASLVEEKQIAYGDSFGRSADFLHLLYPEGVPVNKYKDMLAQVRVFDKLMRIANKKEAFGENPWEDIVGYGLLSCKEEEQEEKEK
jgi:hypothetical protein